MKCGPRLFNTLRRIAPSMLLPLAWASEARAVDQELPIPCATADYTYAVTAGQTLASGTADITTSGDTAVLWSGAITGATPCTGSGFSWTCIGLSVALPQGITPTTPVLSSQKASVTGTAASTGSQSVAVTSTSTNLATPETCTGNFTFHVTSSGGGWGDPHLTTVDGIHYDFQSAGEFTALREDGLVIQTRQSPVPTATVPITNPYTGITHCVSIYTAVAAKLGSTRVTLQPSPGAEPDPTAMQLRVNGKLVTLGEAPLIVRAEGDAAATAGKGGKIDGTLTRHSDGVVEITDARGTQLVVTPQYWDSQKVWYLNVNVYGTSAHEGTMGSLPKGSWLPALPDGSSVGAKPEAEAARYQVLYEKFADAWRVTDATSLFDYQPGTNTATFTRDEWPRNHPQTCAIEGQTSVQAATELVAQQACGSITNAAQKADCVFDVMITGNTGFAKGYAVTQRFTPRGPGWYTPVPPPRSTPPATPCPPAPPSCRWCCWVLIAIGVVQLVLLILLVMRSRNKKP